MESQTGVSHLPRTRTEPADQAEKADCSEEALAIDIDLSLPSERVIRTLDQIIECRGKPLAIRSDNGPEYISRSFIAWATRQGIRLDHIQHGNPQHNAYIERYNPTARYDWISHYLFESIWKVENYATDWSCRS